VHGVRRQSLSGVLRALSAPRLRFCAPKIRDMPDAPLSPQCLLPPLIVARGSRPFHHRYVTAVTTSSNSRIFVNKPYVF